MHAPSHNTLKGGTPEPSLSLCFNRVRVSCLGGLEIKLFGRNGHIPRNVQ